MSIPERQTLEHPWRGHEAANWDPTPMTPVGRKGINLQDAIDDLDPMELSRMINLVSKYGSTCDVRPGQAPLGTTVATRVHSLSRLNDPNAGAFARFAGGDTSLYRGTTGAFGAAVDTGYSGDPLTFCGINMPLTGAPYMVVSDRSRQRKISRTGAVEVFGIPPGALTSTALVTQPAFTIIARFDAIDGTQAASWTATAGQDRSVPPVASGLPVVVDVPGPHVQVTTVPGATVTGYDSIISMPKAMDLATGFTDDDHTRMQFNVSDPQYLEEIKIYLVVSTVFTPGAIPGNSAFNQDAWFKSFRPSDMQAYFERTQSGLDASDDLRLRTLMEQFKSQQTQDEREALITTTGTTALPRQQIPSLGAGRFVWSLFGIAGSPLRRSEWQRISGVEFTRSWSTVTGIVMVFQTNVPQPIQFQFGQWWLYGGSGPDNSDPGANAYDVRVVNYHPVNGSRGNPSATQSIGAWLNAIRQPILVTPTASGTAAMRQQAFLRGGSTIGTQDWYFAGQNSSDGGTITITVNDDTRVTDETLEIDNDQPVTSVNASGATVLNQTLPIYFPLEEYTFGLGDPLQPQRLYRSKLGYPEQWPADDYNDVCPGSDELMNGGQVGSAGYVFSRNRMYTVIINADGTWDAEPSGCNEGLVSRWAMAMTPYGIAFVSPFGVRLTSGGMPENLSDEQIGKMFRGTTVNGFAPIDLTVPTATQLAYHDDELWFSYADTGGTRRQWIYNFKDKTWRNYLFGEPVATVFSEPVQGAAGSLLMGGNATGQIYTHSGFNDDGSGIAFTARTGAYDWDEPHVEKLVNEVIVDAQLQTMSLTVQAFVNNEITSVTAQAVNGVAGLRRYSFEPFGVVPMRVRNVSIELRGTAPTDAVIQFNKLGVTHLLQPSVIMKEPTAWEELPGGEGYCWGVAITADTGDAAITVEVEYTMQANTAVLSAGTLTITHEGRRKQFYSWSSVLAHQMRLRPTGSCLPWTRYKIEWLCDAEPPRVAGWDSNWSSLGTYADKWIKGYLLEADTFNVAKTVVLDIDQALASNSQSLTFNGRGIQHIAFARLRGRLFRLRATDANYGKFFRWQPIFDEEPLALTRYETEERPFEGVPGPWMKPISACLCLRSTANVTWQMITYGEPGAVLDTSSYVITSTAGVKMKREVDFNPVKGVLFAHIFTSASPFYIYREESQIEVEDWVTGQAPWTALFPSNDDLDPPRTMGNAEVAAATPGGA